MWKRCLAISSVLTLILLLDSTLTPAQPGGGKGNFGGKGSGPGGGDGKSFGGRGSPGGDGKSFGGYSPGEGKSFRRPDGNSNPGGPAPGGSFTFTMPGGTGADGKPTFNLSGGMGGDGRTMRGGPGGGMNGGMGPGGMSPGGMGGPGGRSGGFRMDPESGWSRLVSMTGSDGSAVDLSKIPPQTTAMLRGFTERAGGIPLPESGIWTKDAYLDYYAKNEAAKAAFTANGGNGSMSMDPNGFGRGGDRGDRMRGMGMDPNAFGGMNWGGMNGMNGGGNWNNEGPENNWGRQRFERKETEEEIPVALRYGKLPKGLPDWYNGCDTDKDGQVSLYEWRKSSRSTDEFLEMDLNGDGLVTADEYLRFARLKNIEVKVAAYEEGLREPGNWNLGGEKPSGNGNDRQRGFGFGPGGSGQGFGPGSGFNRGGDNRGGDNRGGDNRGGENRGNFNREGNREGNKEGSKDGNNEKRSRGGNNPWGPKQ